MKINIKLLSFAWLSAGITLALYYTVWHTTVGEFFSAAGVGGGINAILYEFGVFHWIFNKKKGEQIAIEMPKIGR